jgi:sterol desaturase/sphingolipid hydroxylase (fatty acid hydroxylase superfamily)
VSNLGIAVIDTLLLRLMFPAAAVGAALFAQAHGWGLFNYFNTLGWVAIMLLVLALDFAIYLQHVLFHAVPALWRVHRMHHADLSMLIKFAVIAALGTPASAVLIFEVLLSATSLFNHSNVRLPQWLERALRWLVVTPYMHRVHHSVEAPETNRNFGFNLPWWDRLFGTYREQPRAGHQGMTLGIRNFRDTKICANLLRLLSLPFIGRTGDYPIDRRWEKPRETRDPINRQAR